jgi:hypothetical protein
MVLLRIVACLMLVAAVGGGCGDGNQNQPPTDADTIGLPQEQRAYVACLRKAGIKVRVPDAVRRLAKKGEYVKRTPHGVEGQTNFFFFLFDKKQRLTKEQAASMRECGAAPS